MLGMCACVRQHALVRQRGAPAPCNIRAWLSTAIVAGYQPAVIRLMVPPQGVRLPRCKCAHAMQICYDRHTGKPLGYAVVHFDNPAAAQYAIDVLHNIEVDGRHIVVAPYRPRVGDPSAPKQAPKGPGGPSADEAIALVMDLHKSATWMCASGLAILGSPCRTRSAACALHLPSLRLWLPKIAVDCVDSHVRGTACASQARNGFLGGRSG